ncbi:helix-turn-helix domain-containing protein [Phaeobacter inhibens]|uniref:Putative HTH-type transcriptional regulator n=1 Tax=Phaeobacter inhibens TaxID=221822 RepID=A0A2I7KH03_9RHOB|nr:helix-turn-helix domain-containing protein [Phaeobacter inhibens]APX18166.1 AraC family transcriptional regulator [Phaeobacter inhibens]AUQ72763.1 putative HTH-type transcriptional regulator [Phaeobacter inhibens]AUR01872.1 putative HTH-type transcriptional regulator [Phaeobacter inhibens]UWR66755.1 helix-turn-helix domain-containing protein [Phaeobacter inhibens]UWR74598.1 helix-turn-helix domain-containing protein [Phaeobacter inhibens]
MTIHSPHHRDTDFAFAQGRALRHIDVVLPEGAPRSSAQIILDLFEAANELLDGVQYRVRVCGLDMLSSGPAGARPRSLVVFLGDIHSRWQLSAKERARVNQVMRLAERSAFVGGAVFLLDALARGQDHDLAIHPNFLASAGECSLRQDQEGAATAVSGTVHSAICNFATPRMLLDIVAADCGRLAADGMAHYLGLDTGKRPTKSRVALNLEQKSAGDTLITQCLAVMQENIEAPLSVAALAETLNVSTRCLQRRFTRHFDRSPLSVYRALRVERAHQLLTQTDIPVRQVAVATGFGSYQSLSQHIRETYGHSPDVIRRSAFRGVAPETMRPRRFRHAETTQADSRVM